MRRLVVSVFILVVVAVGCADASPTRNQARATEPVVVAAVGDIACKSLPSEHLRRCRYDAVAKLIRSLAPHRFLALGDLQYLHGSTEQFESYYDRFFGDLKPITASVPGNHELYTLYGEGYYTYFGKAAHAPGGWYSFDLGDWHVLALNSQICKGSVWHPDLGQNTPITANPAVSDGCGPGSAMFEFAKKDLVLNQDPGCTLAIMHHPLFGSPPWPAGVFLLQLQPLWELLDQQGVDVVLAGHEHNYQRFAPMDAFGRADTNGIREFIVGTGGSTYGDLPKGDAASNREAGQDSSFGALKLTLRDGGYDWEFLTAQGEAPYADAGSADCV
jgi:hypothetical protein